MPILPSYTLAIFLSIKGMAKVYTWGMRNTRTRKLPPLPFNTKAGEITLERAGATV